MCVHWRKISFECDLEGCGKVNSLTLSNLCACALVVIVLEREVDYLNFKLYFFFNLKYIV